MIIFFRQTYMQHVMFVIRIWKRKYQIQCSVNFIFK